jgi:hypothetical protein
VKRFLVDMVWARLAVPVALIIDHFVVLLLALISLAALKWVLKIVGIEDDIVPGWNMTIGKWILDLEIFASSVIIGLGVLEALVVLFLGIVLDCVRLMREIGRAWRS